MSHTASHTANAPEPIAGGKTSAAITLPAIAVGGGIAIGTAVCLPDAGVLWHEYHIAPEQVDDEIHKLRRAQEAAQAALEQELAYARTAPSASASADTNTGVSTSANTNAACMAETVELLETHALLLQDDALIDGAAQWVRAHRYNAAWALHSELQNVVKQYDSFAEGHLRERVQDIKQVVQWLLRHVEAGNSKDGNKNSSNGSSDSSEKTHTLSTEQAGQNTFWEWWEQQHTRANPNTDDALPPILVAHDLTPADMLRLQRCAFHAFVTDSGSATAHIAIMGKSMSIPALVGAVDATKQVKEGDVLAVDANEGILWINPDAQLLADYRHKQAQQRARAQTLLRYRDTDVLGADGQPLRFYANIQHPDDIASVLAAGMDGVGLFRTEYLFMNNTQLPDEQWQYTQYRHVLQSMQDKPVTIRTLDVGADKMLSADGYTAQAEPNPALGLRGLRWCRQNEGILRTQLRALLRAGEHGRLRIMLPMLTNMEEARYCKQLLQNVAQQLRKEGIATPTVQLGAMVEVPAAALIADDLLTVFDFLSIGTNDLVQYTLAADRGNQAVAALQDNLHPAVLWLIQHTVAAGKRCGKPVSVCGEMAGRTDCAAALLASGLRHFSMNAGQLLEMKATLAQCVQAQEAQEARETIPP